jgi:hypothetical protein
MNRLSHPLLLALLLTAGSAAIAQPAPPIVSVPSPAPAPLDPERLAIAQEVVDLAFPPEQRQAMLAKTGETFMAQMRSAMVGPNGLELDSGARAIFERHLDRIRAINGRMIAEGSPPIFVALARAYARAFTRDELLQIRAFIATPTGAKYLQRSMDMLSDPDVAVANTLYFERVMREIRPLQAELLAELTVYFQKHPQRKNP